MAFSSNTGKGAYDYLSSLAGGKALGGKLAQQAAQEHTTAVDQADLQRTLQELLAGQKSLSMTEITKSLDVDEMSVEQLLKPLLEKRMIELLNSKTGTALRLTEIGQRAMRYAKIAKI